MTPQRFFAASSSSESDESDAEAEKDNSTRSNNQYQKNFRDGDRGGVAFNIRSIPSMIENGNFDSMNEFTFMVNLTKAVRGFTTQREIPI